MKNTIPLSRGTWGRSALAALVLATAAAWRADAQEAAVEGTQSAPLYAAGGTLTVSCTFAYPAGRALYSLLWTPTLPAGWTLLSAAGNGAPMVDPYGESIVFFGDLAANPVAFTYTVAVPPGAAGIEQLGATADYLLDGMADPVSCVLTTVPLSDAAPAHDAVGYMAGTPLTVTCTFAYPAGLPLYALMWTPELPPGWTLASAAGDGMPMVDPYGESIVFFGDLSANPLAFTYTVDVPPGAVGIQQLGGEVAYQLAGMAEFGTARVEPDTLPLQAMHRFEVVSAHGVPDPAVGVYTNFFGTPLAPQNTASETVGSRVFACIGWTMVGNEPASGTETSFAMTVSGDAVLTWNWAAPLISPAGTVAVAMDEDGAPTPWAMPAISAIEEGAPDATLTWSLASAPLHGVATISGTGTVPSITYVPTEHWFGTDSFDVRVEDGLGGSDVVTLEVTVQSVNDVPRMVTEIADQSATEDIPFAFTVDAGAFVDDDGDALTWSAEGLPAWLAFDPATRTFSGTPIEGQDGAWTITVSVADPFDATASQAFELVAQPVNDAPQVGVPMQDQGATEDIAFSLTLDAGCFTDSDAGDVLTWRAEGLPVWLSFDPGTRAFSGTPPNGQDGVSTVVVTVRDIAGEEASQSFSLTVVAVNDPPVVEDLVLTTDEDTPVIGRIAASDEEGVALVFAVVQSTTSGAFSLAQDGTVAYAPNLDWSGVDNAVVSVSDGVSTLEVAVQITVRPVVDPLRLLVTLDRTSLETWAGELSEHVYAPDDRAVSFALAGAATRGTVTLTAAGTMSYTRFPEFTSGLEYIPVVASDGQTSVALMVKVMVTDDEGEDIPPVATYINAISVSDPGEGASLAVLGLESPSWPILQSCTDLLVADWQDVPELGEVLPRVIQADGGDGQYVFTLDLDGAPVRFFRLRSP